MGILPKMKSKLNFFFFKAKPTIKTTTKAKKKKKLNKINAKVSRL